MSKKSIFIFITHTFNRAENKVMVFAKHLAEFITGPAHFGKLKVLWIVNNYLLVKYTLLPVVSKPKD